MKTRIKLTHNARSSTCTAIGIAVLVAFTLFSAAIRAPAQPGWGSALWFDGTNDYVLADAVPLANSSFTIEAWARRDTTGTMDMIVAHGGQGAGAALMFGYHWYGFVFDFYGDGVSSTNIDTTWHHWAGTYDASNRVRCLYRDGVLLASNIALTNYFGSGSLYIGREPFGDPAYFAGAIDEVRIWNVARSQAEIQANMSHPLTGSESNLIACWKFDEISGTTTVHDSTANGYDGTLINDPVWTNSTIPPFININAGLPGVESGSVTWGDYDKDGRQDILLTGVSATGKLAQVWHNTGTGFTNVPVPGLPGVSDSSAAWGDYDNDGRLDILLTGHINGYPDYTPIAQVWHNTGSGFTNVPVLGLPGVGDSSVAWGDYNNDGRLDFLLTGNTTNYPDYNPIAQVWENTGSGFTNINAGLPGVGWGSVAWGDCNNDGRADILLTGYSTTGYIAQVWQNTGTGFTNINAGLPGVAWSSAAWGDYDNDGRLDILLAGVTNEVEFGAIAQVWRNTGSGFTNINAGLPGIGVSSVAWGDYDNDGRLDILLTGITNSWNLTNRIAQIWRNTSSGFTNINAGVPAVDWGSVAWGDYDGDGQLDFLLTGWTGLNHLAQVWRNTSGVAKPPPSPPVITHTMLAGMNLIFTGTGGTEGASYHVLSITNLDAAMTNWSRVATNTFGAGGSFSVTNALDPARPRQFFRLQIH